jgi:hypothetical protein
MTFEAEDGMWKQYLLSQADSGIMRGTYTVPAMNIVTKTITSVNMRLFGGQDTWVDYENLDSEIKSHLPQTSQIGIFYNMSFSYSIISYDFTFSSEMVFVKNNEPPDIEFGFYRDFSWILERGEITITAYHGTDSDIIIPAQIEGVPVTIIGHSASAEKQLTKLTLPDSVHTIGFGAFRSNKLTDITLGNNIREIHNSAFANNELTEVTIPGSVEILGIGACATNRLTKVTFSYGLATIGDHAFAGNLLSEITIPDSVSIISPGAFNNNELLKITIGADVSLVAFDSLGDNGFEITYNNGGRMAGTYIRSNTTSTSWTLQP